MSVEHKSRAILLAVFVLYSSLVATHEGEFWPFSIFPMFSQAGNEWSRAVVREVDIDPEAVSWHFIDRSELPDHSFALRKYGLRHDLANFIARTEVWDDERTSGLRQMFMPELTTRRLLIYRVRGRLTDNDDDIRIVFQPQAFLSADTTLLHPEAPLR